MYSSNASILITGGTGSFGKTFVKTVLERHPGIKRLDIFSRVSLIRPNTQNPRYS